jgi:hypothetical protein
MLNFEHRHSALAGLHLDPISLSLSRRRAASCGTSLVEALASRPPAMLPPILGGLLRRACVLALALARSVIAISTRSHDPLTSRPT